MKRSNQANYQIKVFVGRGGLYYLHLVCNSNKQIMLSSEGYASKSNANRAARRLGKLTGLEVIHA